MKVMRLEFVKIRADVVVLTFYDMLLPRALTLLSSLFFYRFVFSTPPARLKSIARKSMGSDLPMLFLFQHENGGVSMVNSSRVKIMVRIRFRVSMEQGVRMVPKLRWMHPSLSKSRKTVFGLRGVS
jgi:hypothetical protein